MAVRKRSWTFFVIALALLALLVGFFTWYSATHATETGDLLTDGFTLSGGPVSSPLSAPLGQDPLSWNQTEKDYLIHIQNESSVSVSVSLTYSRHQPPITFQAPAQGQVAYQVFAPLRGQHTLTFAASEVPISGSVRVYTHGQADSPIYSATYEF